MPPPARSLPRGGCRVEGRPGRKAAWMTRMSPMASPSSSSTSFLVCGWQRYMKASIRKTPLLRGRDDGHRLGGVHADRLLAEDVLARLGRPDRPLGVERVGWRCRRLGLPGRRGGFVGHVGRGTTVAEAGGEGRAASDGRQLAGPRLAQCPRRPRRLRRCRGCPIGSSGKPWTRCSPGDRDAGRRRPQRFIASSPTGALPCPMARDLSLASGEAWKAPPRAGSAPKSERCFLTASGAITRFRAEFRGTRRKGACLVLLPVARHENPQFAPLASRPSPRQPPRSPEGARLYHQQDQSTLQGSPGLTPRPLHERVF